MRGFAILRRRAWIGILGAFCGLLVIVISFLATPARNSDKEGSVPGSHANNPGTSASNNPSTSKASQWSYDKAAGLSSSFSRLRVDIALGRARVGDTEAVIKSLAKLSEVERDWALRHIVFELLNDGGHMAASTSERLIRVIMDPEQRAGAWLELSTFQSSKLDDREQARISLAHAEEDMNKSEEARRKLDANGDGSKHVSPPDEVRPIPAPISPAVGPTSIPDELKPPDQLAMIWKGIGGWVAMLRLTLFGVACVAGTEFIKIVTKIICETINVYFGLGEITKQIIERRKREREVPRANIKEATLLDPGQGQPEPANQPPSQPSGQPSSA